MMDWPMASVLMVACVCITIMVCSVIGYLKSQYEEETPVAGVPLSKEN